MPAQASPVLQFILRALAAGKPTTFFCDEFRSPIYVGDICRAVSAVVEARAQLSHDASPRCLHSTSGLCRLCRWLAQHAGSFLTAPG